VSTSQAEYLYFVCNMDEGVLFSDERKSVCREWLLKKVVLKERIKRISAGFYKYACESGKSYYLMERSIAIREGFVKKN
jgi:hypothetical protein